METVWLWESHVLGIKGRVTQSDLWEANSERGYHAGIYQKLPLEVLINSHLLIQCSSNEKKKKNRSCTGFFFSINLKLVIFIHEICIHRFRELKICKFSYLHWVLKPTPSRYEGWDISILSPPIPSLISDTYCVLPFSAFSFTVISCQLTFCENFNNFWYPGVWSGHSKWPFSPLCTSPG